MGKLIEFFSMVTEIFHRYSIYKQEAFRLLYTKTAFAKLSIDKGNTNANSNHNRYRCMYQTNFDQKVYMLQIIDGQTDMYPMILLEFFRISYHAKPLFRAYLQRCCPVSLYNT